MNVRNVTSFAGSSFGRSLMVFLAVALFPITARGEIVNVLPKADRDEDGVFISVAFPLEWRTGNTSLVRVGGSGDIMLKRGDNALLFLVNGDYGKTDGDVYLSRHFEHLRYRHTFTDRIGFEAYLQHSFDEFRRLSYRLVGGGGPIFTLFKWKAGDVTWGTAYMAELEEYTEEVEQADSGERVFTNRWSNYLRVGLKFGENLSFSHTTFAQPAITGFSDVRISSESAIRILNGKIFLQTAASILYNTRVPQSVEKLDTAITSSIGASF